MKRLSGSHTSSGYRWHLLFATQGACILILYFLPRANTPYKIPRTFLSLHKCDTIHGVKTDTDILISTRSDVRYNNKFRYAFSALHYKEGVHHLPQYTILCSRCAGCNFAGILILIHLLLTFYTKNRFNFIRFIPDQNHVL